LRGVPQAEERSDEAGMLSYSKVWPFAQKMI